MDLRRWWTSTRMEISISSWAVEERRRHASTGTSSKVRTNGYHILSAPTINRMSAWRHWMWIVTAGRTWFAAASGTAILENHGKRLLKGLFLERISQERTTFSSLMSMGTSGLIS